MIPTPSRIVNLSDIVCSLLITVADRNGRKSELTDLA
jgi:hypothetical protein